MKTNQSSKTAEPFFMNGHNGSQKNIAIAGLGLMGTSLALALKASGHRLWGIEPQTSHLEKALELGAIEGSISLEEAAENAWAIVLCAPVDVNALLLQQLLAMPELRAAITDVGSTKEVLCLRVSGMERRGHFVAAHPMCGLAQKGPEHARRELFTNSNCFLCDTVHSDSWAVERISELFQEAGCHIHRISASQHDHLAALVSHLPQLLTYAIAALPQFGNSDYQNWPQMASSGLDSTTRLASSPASIWRPVFEENLHNLIPLIDAFSNQLIGLRQSMLHGHWPALMEAAHDAASMRQTLETNKESLQPIPAPILQVQQQ